MMPTKEGPAPSPTSQPLESGLLISFWKRPLLRTLYILGIIIIILHERSRVATRVQANPATSRIASRDPASSSSKLSAWQRCNQAPGQLHPPSSPPYESNDADP